MNRDHALSGLVVLLVIASVSASRAQVIGEPRGTISQQVYEEAPDPNLMTQVVRVFLEVAAEERGADFAGVDGYEFAVRVHQPYFSLAVTLPEGNSNHAAWISGMPTWMDLRIDFANPLPEEDGRVLLVEFKVQRQRELGWGRWVGTPIEINPSPHSSVPGWITWRESATGSARRESGLACQPCVHPVDRIRLDRDRPFAADRLVVIAPHVVVAPGERFDLSLLFRCRSDLAWYLEFDLQRVQADLTWDSSQLRLVDDVGAETEGSATLVREFDPPFSIDNSSSSSQLGRWTFEAGAPATGTNLVVGAVSASTTDIPEFAAREISGSVRVMDCTPQDLDGDGDVDSADAVQVLLQVADGYLTGEPPSAAKLCTSDADRDGQLTSNDARSVLRSATGLRREALPVAGEPRIALEREGERILLRIDGAAGASVHLDLGGVLWKGVAVDRGGLAVSRSRAGRAVVAVASLDPTEHVVELDVAGEGRIAIVAVEGARGESLEFDPRPIVVRGADRFLGAHPNPFNPSTRLRFVTQDGGTVVLEIFDASGRRVRTLRVEAPAGPGQVTWDGCDDEGRAVASGIYHVSMATDRTVASGRIVLLK